MKFLQGDDVPGQIDWDNLLDGLPFPDNIFELEPPLTTCLQPIDDSSNSLSPANDKVSSWIGEIETLLMKDDDDKVDQLDNCSDFLADILVDSPAAHESRGEVLDASTDKDSTSSDDADGGPKEKDDGKEEKNKDNEEEDPDDIVSKKRRRQLRNKDAAVRSRERKKMHVRDLEVKSRYLEGECRRLDRLLQCFIAENHALRLCLQRGSAIGVTSAKQESAVLVLESLLLGSLLWFLGIMCLFPQPAMPQSSLVEVRPETMEKKATENAALRGSGSEVFISSGNSRRCKASRPRMKPTDGTTVRVELGDATTAADPADVHSISRSFPLTYGQPLAHFLRATSKVPDAQVITDHPAVRVGIVFCGRQSPGGHNVIWGLHNALKTHNPNSTLFGFLGGSEGLFAQKTLEITDDILSTYKNQGGYDLLGRTKDQIRTTEQVNAALTACKDLKLDGLVIIGGVTSNTDAAQLAETFAEAKCPTKVVGVPVTLNGDLKNQFVETNVGFDTICKVNSQLISNVCTDALSAEKYYYFIRLMGRKASHVALECTLQSHPNMVILGEEVAASKLTLFDLTTQICDAVQARAGQDKNHGVILLPEGLIESIPEVYALLKEIHGLLRHGVAPDNISSQLSPWTSALFEFLPPYIRKQLLLHPESDDSAQLSQIETEKLLAHLVETEMNKRLKEGTYKGKKFNAICHFFGYQARGSLPSKFDCDYAYVLGHISYHILAAGLNGYMATVTNLKNPVNKWRCGAAPITAMMTVKRWAQSPGASSIGKPAIHPAIVDLKGKAYELLRQNAGRFWMDDLYRNPGPLQFDGPGADSKAVTLCVEDQDYMGGIKKLQEYLDKVKNIVKPGCSREVLKAALSVMSSVTDVLSVMSSTSSNGQTPL